MLALDKMKGADMLAALDNIRQNEGFQHVVLALDNMLAAQISCKRFQL